MQVYGQTFEASEVVEKIESLINDGEYFDALSHAGFLALSDDEGESAKGELWKARVFDALDQKSLELRIYEHIYSRFGNSESAHDVLVTALYNYAILLSDEGRYEDAIDKVDALENIIDIDSKEEKIVLARALFNKTAYYYHLNDFKQQLDLSKKLIGLFEKDEDPQVQAQVGRAFASLAERDFSEGNSERAAENVEKAIDLIKDTSGIQDTFLPSLHGLYGMILEDQGKIKRAKSEYLKALESVSNPTEEKQASLYVAGETSIALLMYSNPEMGDFSKHFENALEVAEQFGLDEQARRIRELLPFDSGRRAEDGDDLSNNGNDAIDATAL